MNEFQELVKAVADELEGWEYIPRTDDYYGSCFEQIGRRDSGAIIALSSRPSLREDSRLNVYGQYPTHNGKGRYHSGTTPRITIAAKRGATAIAKDITKRFLPKYLPLYEEAVAWVQGKVEADNRDATNLADIAEVLGMTAPKPNSKQVRLRVMEIWGHFKAGYDGTFHVDLYDVPLNVALAIARVLRES